MRPFVVGVCKIAPLSGRVHKKEISHILTKDRLCTAGYKTWVSDLQTGVFAQHEEFVCVDRKRYMHSLFDSKGDLSKVFSFRTLRERLRSPSPPHTSHHHLVGDLTYNIF